MYSAFMDHLVDLLPEKWIEKSGGSIIRAISKISPQYGSFNKLYDKMLLTAPWGISSGWADSLGKMESLSKLGAGLVVSKTITLHPRYGNPYPRVIRNKPLMINSMGLPNPGLKYWVNKLAKETYIPKNYMFSIHGETEKDWNILISKIKKFNRPLELNFSCPNVKEGVIDLDSTANILSQISKENSDAHLYLKLSPQYTDNQLLELIELSVENEYVQGISLFNTYPVKHNQLGNPRKAGGLSGPRLYPRLLQMLVKIRSRYRTETELPILAMGGISNLQQAQTIYNEYHAVPLLLTAFLMQGPFIFKNWWKEYSKLSTLN